MDAVIADLFRKHRDISAFRDSVVVLNGRFPFDTGDMLAMGEAYFERFPDCFSNRNCQEVQIGYQMVRICSVEKIIAALPETERTGYRVMFFTIGAINETVDAIVARKGASAALDDLELVNARLAEVKGVIDTLPTGMVKERFVGGISNIFNVVYLIRTSIERHR